MSLDEINLKRDQWRGKIAERLVALRTRRHMTTAAAARALNWNASTLGDYENGRVTPTAKRLVLLARFYDCSIDFILLGLGWGGVEVADYDALIHSLPPQAPARQEAMAAKPKGPGVKVKKEPKPPVAPRTIKVAKGKKRKPAKKATQVAPRRGRMVYDFNI